ncbi:hypothetical protein V8E55_011851 [Tylopilus felleus]
MAKLLTMRPKQVWFQLLGRQSDDSIPEFQACAANARTTSPVPTSPSASHLTGSHHSIGLYDDAITDTLMDVIIPPSPESQSSAPRHIVNNPLLHSLSDIILADASQSDNDVINDDCEDVLSGIQLPQTPTHSDEGHNDARTDYLIDIDILSPPAVHDDAKGDVLSGIVILSSPLSPCGDQSADRHDIEMDNVEVAATEKVEMADSANINLEDDRFKLPEWVKKMRRRKDA